MITLSFTIGLPSVTMGVPGFDGLDFLATETGSENELLEISSTISSPDAVGTERGVTSSLELPSNETFLLINDGVVPKASVVESFENDSASRIGGFASFRDFFKESS